MLNNQLNAAISARKAIVDKDEEALRSEGFYLEFQLSRAASLENTLKSLESLRGAAERRIELMVVREISDELLSATIFVPEGRQNHFQQKIEEYGSKPTKAGNPSNEPMIAPIERIALGQVFSLYNDKANFPDPQTKVWWEAWLIKGVQTAFRARAGALDLLVSDEVIEFRERDVIAVHATAEELERLLQTSRFLAELRLVKDTARTFLEMEESLQTSFIVDLQDRTSSQNEHGIYINVLDTGIAQSHPLIRNHLKVSHCLTLHPLGSGGNQDPGNHGTRMAGIALYGDLVHALATPGHIVMQFGLESSKILPDPGGVPNPKRLWGAVTQQGVYRAEINNPTARRVACIAITEWDVRQTGRPTSWSAALDQLAFEDDETQRLIVISTGNINKRPLVKSDYLNQNDLEGIESPAQSWNALTVGAYTTKTTLVDPTYAGYFPVARAGEMSPHSLTSTFWDRQWPIKPDIVLEGGNLASSASGSLDSPDDLRLLSTRADHRSRAIDVFDGTSAATALASRMSAQIYAAYPDLWPETVRALMVHSAEWTPEMLEILNDSSLGRLDIRKSILLRRYGYGVPNIDRAINSAKNDVTLLVQDYLQPYKKDGSVKTNEMNLHKFPWPKRLLENLSGQVEMRVTLSYFVEPNPGERGWNTRHNYASHGLRFEAKGAEETERAFLYRVNRAARDEEVFGSGGGDGWVMNSRRGSVFSDVWRGNAEKLASKDAIGIFPTMGWWRQKPHLGDWQRRVRYSLIVSIRIPDTSVDVYTPVRIALETVIETDTPVTIETKI